MDVFDKALHDRRDLVRDHEIGCACTYWYGAVFAPVHGAGNGTSWYVVDKDAMGCIDEVLRDRLFQVDTGFEDVQEGCGVIGYFATLVDVLGVADVAIVVDDVCQALHISDGATFVSVRFVKG